MTKEVYERELKRLLNSINQATEEINELQEEVEVIDINVKLQDTRNKMGEAIDVYKADYEKLDKHKKTNVRREKHKAELKNAIEKKQNRIEKLGKEKKRLSKNLIIRFINRKRIKEIESLLSLTTKQLRELSDENENLTIIYNSDNEKMQPLQQKFDDFEADNGVRFEDIIKLDVRDFNDLLERRRPLVERIDGLKEKVKFYSTKIDELDREHDLMNDTNKEVKNLSDKILDMEFPKSERLSYNPGTNIDRALRKLELLGKSPEELKSIIEEKDYSEKKYLNEKEN